MTSLLGPLTLALARIATLMGNTPSVTGPDRGRSHVIRDDDSSVNSHRGQRPVRLRVEETVAQLAEEFCDEETNRRSSSLSVPESRTSHNGALQRGATMSSDIAPEEVAEEDELSFRSKEAVRKICNCDSIEDNKARRVEIANNGNGRGDKTMCQETTSSECEQNQHDENWSFRVKEIG